GVGPLSNPALEPVNMLLPFSFAGMGCALSGLSQPPIDGMDVPEAAYKSLFRGARPVGDHINGVKLVLLQELSNLFRGSVHKMEHARNADARRQTQLRFLGFCFLFSFAGDCGICASSRRCLWLLRRCRS